MERNGHAARMQDLERFASLGIRAIRYPVLWERTAPDGIESADWSWSDERLPMLQQLGVTPIVGLIHHGSGPGIRAWWRQTSRKSWPNTPAR
jgi:dTDP-4-dehydrorhamnose reductase